MLKSQIPSEQCGGCPDFKTLSEPLILREILSNQTDTAVVHFFTQPVEIHDLGLGGVLALHWWHHSGVLAIQEPAGEIYEFCTPNSPGSLHFLVSVRCHWASLSGAEPHLVNAEGAQSNALPTFN